MKTILRNNKLGRNIALVFFGMIFLFLMLFLGSPRGLATSPDSIAYIKGAYGYLYGQGYAFVSNEWPPLFPTWLMIFGHLNQDDVMLGARVFHSILLSLTFLLTYLLLRRTLNYSALISCTLAGLFCIQTPIIQTYFYAWSEPTLLTLLLANIFVLQLLTRYRDSFCLHIELVLVVLASAAFLTRFSGICIVTLNAVMLFVHLRPLRLPLRIFRSALQIVLPILIFLPWLSHYGVSNGSATQRAISFHPITLQSVEYGLSTIGKWFVPNPFLAEQPDLQYAFFLVGCIVVATVILFLFRFLSDRTLWAQDGTHNLSISGNLRLTLVFFLVIYFVFLVAALSFIDNKVILDNRILTPAYICVYLLVIELISHVKKRIALFGSISILVLVLVSAYPGLKSWLLINYYNGVELSDKNFQSKAVFQFAKTCSKETIVYADNPWHFDLIFKSKVMWLPRRILFNTGRTNEQYEAEVQSLHLKAGLIIVEDRDSEIVLKIGPSAAFNKIYDAPDGLIWENVQIRAGTCAK